MPLKQKEIAPLSNTNVPIIYSEEKLKEPWGSIDPTPYSVETLCLFKGIHSSEMETISYPYRMC